MFDLSELAREQIVSFTLVMVFFSIVLTIYIGHKDAQKKYEKKEE